MIVDKIHNEDCLVTMSHMPDGFIDLVITSPPYNVDLGNNKYNKNPYDLYNDNKEHKDYIKELKNIFQKMYPKLVKGGRIAINIGDGKNGMVPTSSDIIQFMCELKYIPMTHIIWDKSQTSNRAAFGSYLSPSCPSFPTPFEHILVFAKENRRLQIKGETDLIRDEFIEWSLSLWKFAPEKKQKIFGHSAMFPEELPKRCIKMLSWKNTVIYDPFCGVGTTCYVAKKLGRHYIGSDISKKYCKMAKKRIEKI